MDTVFTSFISVCTEPFEVQTDTNNSLSNVIGHFSISFKVTDLCPCRIFKNLKTAVYSNSLWYKGKWIQTNKNDFLFEWHKRLKHLIVTRWLLFLLMFLLFEVYKWNNKPLKQSTNALRIHFFLLKLCARFTSVASLILFLFLITSLPSCSVTRYTSRGVTEDSRMDSERENWKTSCAQGGNNYSETVH